MLGFRKFLIAEKCVDKKRGGSINIFLRNFLSHSDKIFRRGTPLGVTDFGYRKNLCLRGLCHDFSTNFLSHSTRKVCRGTLLYCVLEKFPVANNFMDKKGRSVEICR